MPRGFTDLIGFLVSSAAEGWFIRLAISCLGILHTSCLCFFLEFMEWAKGLLSVLIPGVITCRAAEVSAGACWVLLPQLNAVQVLNSLSLTSWISPKSSVWPSPSFKTWSRMLSTLCLHFELAGWQSQPTLCLQPQRWTLCELLLSPGVYLQVDQSHG